MGHSTEMLSIASLVRPMYSIPTCREGKPSLPGSLLPGFCVLQVAAALQGSQLLIIPQHRGPYPITFVGKS